MIRFVSGQAIQFVIVGANALIQSPYFRFARQQRRITITGVGNFHADVVRVQQIGRLLLVVGTRDIGQRLDLTGIAAVAAMRMAAMVMVVGRAASPLGTFAIGRHRRRR